MSGCQIIPYPAARRHHLVSSIARRSLELGVVAGERHITRSLELQAKVLRRKGVAQHLIVRETRALESAVRAQMWNAVLLPREEG
jgi:Family of unknown function (DUF6074)